jgi:hypothetical protein
VKGKYFLVGYFSVGRIALNADWRAWMGVIYLVRKESSRKKKKEKRKKKKERYKNPRGKIKEGHSLQKLMALEMSENYK